MRLKGMIAYAALYIGITAFVFALAYAMNESQSSRMANLEGVVSEIKAGYLRLSSIEREQKMQVESMTNLEHDMAKMTEDFEVLREQCHKLRKDQIDLQDSVSRKRPLIKLPSGAIQVEILPGKPPYTPSKSMGKKGTK